MTWGVATPAARITAQPAAANVACLVLRRLARSRMRASEPGGGLSGDTSAPSQSSIGSRGLVTGFSDGGFEPGPGVEQIGLDRALGAAEHHRHLLEPETAVVVQQERAAQSFGQGLDKGTDVHILGWVIGGLGRAGGGHHPDRVSLPAGLAPVIAD